jgi:hypothetical protein
MRNVLNLISAATILAVSSFAGTPKPAAEKAIEAAEKSLVDAMVKGDKAGVERLLGDDLAYTHSSGKTETKAEVVKSVGSTRSMEMKDPSYKQYGNVVVTTHKAAITNAQGVTNNLFITHVWANQNGGWQLVSRQATKLP